ncbi:hypothetical protein [Streptomyces sp. NPDC047990]|uniref:hypothetical protein n=1 Tax=Streptomyces sp. NPDC047990 TaxID=3365496 RepID=UPI003714D688
MATPKRGKRQTKSARGGVIFETDVGFMIHEVQKDIRYKRTAEMYARYLAAAIIRAAPVGPHKYTWEYSIKKNIKPYVSMTNEGWMGFVMIEENPRARHAILQDQGYTGRDHHRHQGLFFIKKVLEQERKA